MSKITLLNQETIDKIAAGEVVERPASVVKELVENAIDAGATAVTVEIKEGGISFIRITDNGCGIEKEQISMAFLRHSTSKIREVEDLLNITSLGFRGEALSSIAAVSQVELITKTHEDLTGIRYVIEGSVEKAKEEIGAPDGTTFLVRNLFYNTPARQKFLKSSQTEGGYIGDLMERLALSHPNVSMKFIANGQTKMHTAGNSNEKDMIYHIYGRDITASLLPVCESSSLFQVHGFIGKPMISRGNRNYENYFINGRYIKSALLSKAVEEAYKGFLMQHQYPFCVLYFSMDTSLLDINVHPTKMELRFQNQEAVYHQLFDVIRSALNHKDFIPQVPVAEEKSAAPILSEKIPEPFEVHRRNEERQFQNLKNTVVLDTPYERKYPNYPAAGKKQETYQTQETVNVHRTSGVQEPFRMQDSFNAHKPSEMKEPVNTQEMSEMQESFQSQETVNAHRTSGTQETLSETNSYQNQKEAYAQQELGTISEDFLTKTARKKHRIIGQLFATYWLIEYEDKLFIVDQHAAHEKVLYERTMKKLKEQNFTSQTISPPVILTLDHAEAQMLEQYKNQLELFGYSISFFGGKEYAIDAVPADFTSIDMKNMFVEMLDDFANINGGDAPNQIMEKVASMSCKAAVKGNDKLSVSEAESLLDELLELENPYHCPHGRPTIISMSKYELEKKFKRLI